MDIDVDYDHAVMTINGINYRGSHTAVFSAFRKAIGLNSKGETAWIDVEADGVTSMIRVTEHTQLALHFESSDDVDLGDIDNVVSVEPS